MDTDTAVAAQPQVNQPDPLSGGTTGQQFQSSADAVQQQSAPQQQTPQQSQPAQQAPPPAKKPSVMSDILHAVAEVLGGPSSHQVVDPQTGAVHQVQFSRVGRIVNTAGTLLRGAAAGAAQHGPGSVGRAALAGADEQQQFQQQQNQNVLQQSQNVQEQLKLQGQQALQAQELAVSSWRMAREGTEIDEATAKNLNTMAELVASNPENHLLGHLDSFADATKSHPDLLASGVNIQQLLAKGKLRSVVTTQGGKSTGVNIYTVSPDWENTRTTDPTTVYQAVGFDAKGNPKFETHVLPAGSITNGAALQLFGASAKNQMDAVEKAAQIRNQTQATNATVAEKGAQTKLANAQAQQIIGAQQADPFGNVSTLPQKELLKRQDTFQSQVVNKAYDVEKAYQMSQQALAEYKDAAAQGKTLPTGAQSMLLLSQHLGTTFGNVKGSRITKDMITEHLGARGVTDDAQSAVQRIVNGDQLSPAQWQAFTGLIGQSRNATWGNAVSNAKNQQLPITFLPRGNGKTPIDKNTAQLYLDAAGGDWQKASAAAQKQGWQL